MIVEATMQPGADSRRDEHVSRHVQPRTCDVLVAGSGAAGLTAALVLRSAGLDVVLAEKTPLIGGTTTHSEGMIWIPRSPQALRAGVEDSNIDATAYLRAVLGRHYRAEMAEAFVETGPKMLEFLEANSLVRFALAENSLDYFQEQPGATRGKRSLYPVAFDGRRLGPDLALLRHPLPTTTILGGMVVPSADLGHFFAATRSARSFARVSSLVARYAWDRIRGRGRGTYLANGVGLIAALLTSYRRFCGELLTNAALVELNQSGSGRTEATLETSLGQQMLSVSRAVIFACGGFSANRALRERLFPGAPDGSGFLRLVAESASGDALEIATRHGAALQLDQAQPAAWAPASWSSVHGAAYPHFLERSKPGFIAVERTGRRFVNEACGYHEFVPAMIAANGSSDAPTWLIGDRDAVRSYGIGVVPPAPWPIEPYVRRGYIVRAASIEALAGKIGLDPAVLSATVERYNGLAARGIDTDFAKGRSERDRAYGDTNHGPNACVGPLKRPPFYAVRLYPSDLGTLVGLLTDTHGRVLDPSGNALPRVFAVGNDMASVMGGHYPAGGVTLGPAMTFAYRAARRIIAED